MPLLVVGLSHATAPLELLERVRVPSARLPEAVAAFAAIEDLNEVVVLSTCQRMEVYADSLRFHPSLCAIAGLLSDRSGTDVGAHIYSYYDDEAAGHLFEVAAGLDSSLLGESEILGQVRAAWRTAQEEGTAGQKLSALFRHAIEAGKRSRRQTGIARGNTSLGSTVVAMAKERLGPLAGRSAVVVGTGAAGAAVATALVGAEAGQVTVVSRDPGRASTLAWEVDTQAASLADLPSTLTEADLVVTATDASGPVIRRSQLQAVMSRRPGRPLVVIDVAVPRNVDRGCAALPGVSLADLDDVKRFAERALDNRRAEVAEVRRILAEELDRFTQERTGRLVAPVVAAFRRRAEELCAAELRRVRGQLASLPPGTAEVVETVTRGIVNKLLHTPTVRLKAEAGNTRGEVYVEALQALFELDAGDLDAGAPERRPTSRRARRDMSPRGRRDHPLVGSPS